MSDARVGGRWSVYVSLVLIEKVELNVLSLLI